MLNLGARGASVPRAERKRERERERERPPCSPAKRVLAPFFIKNAAIRNDNGGSLCFIDRGPRSIPIVRAIQTRIPLSSPRPDPRGFSDSARKRNRTAARTSTTTGEGRTRERERERERSELMRTRRHFAPPLSSHAGAHDRDCFYGAGPKQPRPSPRTRTRPESGRW